MSIHRGLTEVAWPKMSPLQQLGVWLWPLTARLLCRLGSHYPLHAQCDRECWCLFCQRSISRFDGRWHSH